MGLRHHHAQGNCGISGLEWLWVQELVARSLAIKKVGTDERAADVGTKCIEDGKKLTHLLGLGCVRVKRGLELAAVSVVKVALQGCASIVHVQGTVTGSRQPL